MMVRAPLLLVLLLLGAALAPARAERLIVSVSNHRVTVTPNYSGEALVLLGSVEKDASTPANRTYDLVVTVAGPRADMVTRRKERKFGIWINTDYRQFLKVPTYLALFSNRPFDAIASPEVQRRQQLGLNNWLLTPRGGPDYGAVLPNEALRSAILQLRSEYGLDPGEAFAWPFLTRVIVASAPVYEQTIASAAVPTMQRIGYAVGAALAGIIANASGFSEGLNRDAAASVAGWLFLAFVPLGIVGCLAAIKIAIPTARPQEAAG